MKNTPLISKSLPIAAVLLAAGTLHAATLSWNPLDATSPAAASGGSTTSSGTEWATTNAAAIWRDGATKVAWTNGNDATFAGTAGTVSLGSDISAGTLNFATTGYNVDLRDFDATTTSFNLTLTGLSGNGSFINSNALANNSSIRTLTLNLAASSSFSGNIGTTNGRLGFTLNSANTFTMSGQLLVRNTFGAPNLIVQGGGRLELVGNTSSSATGSLVTVTGNSTFDVGNNLFAGRSWTVAAGSTITSSGTGRLIKDTNSDTATLNGTLTGSLGLESTGGSNLSVTSVIAAGANTFSGGTFVTGNLGNVSNQNVIRVTNNSGLGTGRVSMENTQGTAIIRFETATPTIGWLSSSNAGTKSIVLGTTGVDTALSINQSSSGDFGGVISQFTGRSGSLTKTGSAALTLSGANTYTGRTTVNSGTLILSSTGSITSTSLGFGVTDAANGKLTVQNVAYAFSGTIHLTLNAVTVSSGSWTLFDGSQFSSGDLNLAGVTSDIVGLTFSKTGDIWSGSASARTWSFDQSLGTLNVIPEPSTFSVFVLSGLGLIVLRRRMRRA